MKKISILLIIALLLNITFSVTIFAKNEVTEELQLNNFINYAEEDGVLPSGWSNNDNNNENTMLKPADSENDGEKCLSFDCSSKTGRINGKNFTNQTAGKILLESRVLFTKKSGLSLSFTGTSDAVRPGVTLYQDGLDDGQWHDMRIVIDITNGTISMGYDGEEPVVKVKDITFSYGVQRFYFANWSTSNSVVKIQYLNAYKYHTEAKPVKFSANTVLNEKVDFQNGDTVKSGINTLNIIFDANLANVGEDAVYLQVKDEDTYNAIPTELKFSGKTVTLTCEPLMAGKEYRIVIVGGIVTTANITSEEEHEISFITDEGDVTATLDNNINDVIEGTFAVTYENDFSDAEDFTPVGDEMGVVNGLTAVRTDDDIANDGYLTVIPKRSTTAFKLSYGSYVEAGDYVKVSFDYMAPSLDSEAEIQFYGGDGEESANLFKIKDYCGGEEFKANEWQTYHVEVYPNTNTGAHEFKMYRGDNGDFVQKTKFSMDATNTTGLRLRFSKNKTDEANCFDNIKVEKKSNSVTEKIVTANVKNTTAEVYKAYIIYSEYSENNELLGTQYKFIEVPANAVESFDITFKAPSDDEIAKAYVYLWEFGTSVPVSEPVIVK